MRGRRQRALIGQALNAAALTIDEPAGPYLARGGTVPPPPEMIHDYFDGLVKSLTIVFFVLVVLQLVAAFPATLLRSRKLTGLQTFHSLRWVGILAVVLGAIGGLGIIYQSILTGHSGSASVWGA